MSTTKSTKKLSKADFFADKKIPVQFIDNCRTDHDLTWLKKNLGCDCAYLKAEIGQIPWPYYGLHASNSKKGVEHSPNLPSI